MEISGWTLYWITRLDFVGGFCVASAIAFALCIIAFVVPGLIHRYDPFFEDDKSGFGERLLNHARRLILPLVIAVLLAGLIPSTKEMAAFIVIPKIANSEFVTKDAPEEIREIYSLAKDYLKQQVEQKKDK